MKPVRDREESFRRFSQVVDGPLMVLALAMVPLLVIPLVFDLPSSTERGLLIADYLIWVVFAIEYLVKLWLVSDRKRFVRENVTDLVIIVIPFLRPLRILRSARALRVLRLARLIAFAAEGLTEVRSILRKKGLNYVLLFVLVIVFVAAALVRVFERGAAGANISSYPDALWWAATTVTTVGYGDRFPMTAAGRGVAVALMVAGIALFGVITATIAAHFVEQEEQRTDAAIAAQLDAISARLERIEQGLRAQE